MWRSCQISNYYTVVLFASGGGRVAKSRVEESRCPSSWNQAISILDQTPEPTESQSGGGIELSLARSRRDEAPLVRRTRENARGKIMTGISTRKAGIPIYHRFSSSRAPKGRVQSSRQQGYNNTKNAKIIPSTRLPGTLQWGAVMSIR
jgi:hypothetical protein